MSGDIIESVSSIAADGVALTRTGLQLPEDLTGEQWTHIGHALGAIEHATQWIIGDWWSKSPYEYGERKAIVEAEDWDGPSYKTCKNAASVAGKFKRSRRRDLLSFDHHRAVASLDPDDADAILDRAEAEELPLSKVRQLAKSRKRELKTENVRGKAEKRVISQDMDIRQGDCMDVIHSLADHSIDLLLTDPPYHVTENEWDMWDTEDDYWQFMQSWLAALRPKMAEQYNAFIFCDADASPRLAATLLDTGWDVLRQAIWFRPNLAKKRSGSLTFQSSYEPFWHCGTRGLAFPEEWGDERFDVQKYTVPQSNHVEDKSYHPTQKPVALFERLVSLGSSQGDVIFDPFCGGGTTAVAAMRKDVRCITCDLSEEYIEITNGRVANEQGATQQ